MDRMNYTCEGEIREYKNGNLHLKLSPDALKDIERGRYSDIECLSWLLDSLDCYFIGDMMSAGNYDMCAMVYNCHSDYIYFILFGYDIENRLKKGYTVTLKARRPDPDDREIIERYYND